MSQTPNSTPTPRRRPGRPPSDAARHAILEAAHRILMTDGLGRLTIERVAAEAGVGKPTIYRTWTNAQELAMAAFMAQPDAAFAAPRARTARAAWVAHLGAVIRTLATNRGRQITLTMASADPDSELAKAFRNQVILKSREAGRQLIALAVHSGEMRAQADVETVLDMVYGPLFFRLLAGHLPLAPEFAAQLVDTVFDGVAARLSPARGRQRQERGPSVTPGEAERPSGAENAVSWGSSSFQRKR